MRISTLLLSSAALLAGATAGLAADLPSKKAAPVEYVRVCSQFGAGFFYIPGSDTCIKVGGRVRADYFYNEPLTRASNTTSTRARGYLSLDSYTASDWGPIRATTRVYVTKDSGSSSSTALDYAYIQFAGVTAGRIATSFFEFAPFGGVSMLGGGTNGRGSDYGAINALAYTFKAGNVSATLALEDGSERRVGISSGAYAGHAAPDLVGRLDYSDTWGVLALTAAAHQIRSGLVSTTTTTLNAPDAGGPVTSTTTTTISGVNDTEYGFAIQGGLKINLPMLAAGDALFLQAAYADGASSYTGWGTLTAGNINAAGTANGYDAYVDANGHLKTVKSWSVVGGVEHYWTPALSTAVFASYGSMQGLRRDVPKVGAVEAYTFEDDWKVFAIGANVKWTPVKNLLIGAEAVYQKATDVPYGYVYSGGTQDNIWSGRLRVQRDF